MNSDKIKGKFLTLLTRVIFSTSLLCGFFYEKNSFSINEETRLLQTDSGTLYVEVDFTDLKFDFEENLKFVIENLNFNYSEELLLPIGPNSKRKSLLKFQNLTPGNYRINLKRENLPESVNKRISVQYLGDKDFFEVGNKKASFGKIVLKNSRVDEKTEEVFGRGISAVRWDLAGYLDSTVPFVQLKNISKNSNLVVYDSVEFSKENNALILSRLGSDFATILSKGAQDISNLKSDGKKVVFSITDATVFKFLNNKSFEEGLKRVIEFCGFDGILFDVKEKKLSLNVLSFVANIVKYFRNSNSNFLLVTSLNWKDMQDYKNDLFIDYKAIGSFVSSLPADFIDYAIVNYFSDYLGSEIEYFDKSGNSKTLSIKKDGALDFYKYLTLCIVEASEKNSFYTINPNKLIIGLPVSPDASNYFTGSKDFYLNKNDVNVLCEFLQNKNLTIPGFVGYNAAFDYKSSGEFSNLISEIFSIENNYASLKINLDISQICEYSNDIPDLEVKITTDREETYKTKISLSNPVLILKNLPISNRQYKIEIQGLINPTNGKVFGKIETDAFELGSGEIYTLNLKHTLLNKPNDLYTVKFSLLDAADANSLSRKSRNINYGKIIFSERDSSDYKIVSANLDSASYKFRRGQVIDFSIVPQGIKSYSLNRNFIAPNSSGIDVTIDTSVEDLPSGSKRKNLVYYNFDDSLKLEDISDAYNMVAFCFATSDTENCRVFLKDTPNNALSNLNLSIKELNKQGRKVLLSIKGDDFSLDNILKGEIFVKTLTEILDKYNFNGLNFYFVNSENYKNFDATILANYFKQVVEARKQKDSEFISMATFNYAMLNRNLIQKTKGLSEYLIRFLKTFNVDDFDYLTVELFGNYGAEYALKGYDFNAHSIGNYDCTFGVEDGIDKFLPNAVWALGNTGENITFGDISINSDYSILPLAKDKLIPLIPVSKDSVDGCPDMQIIKAEALGNIIAKALKNGAFAVGLAVWDANDDKDFILGKEIAKNLNIKFSDENFLQNCSNLSGSIKISLASLEDEGDAIDFDSIKEVYAEIYQVFPSILKNADSGFDYPYNRKLASFNIPLRHDGDPGTFTIENAPISFSLTADQIKTIFTGNGYVLQDWIDEGSPNNWEIKPVYYVFVNGPCNPKTGNIFRPILPSNFIFPKETFFNQESGYVFNSDAQQGDQLVIELAFTDKLNDGEKSILNFEVTAPNDFSATLSYQYRENKNDAGYRDRPMFNYVSDNLLEDGAYAFPLYDSIKIRPLHSKNYVMQGVSYDDNSIDLDKFYDLSNKNLPVNFIFSSIQRDFGKINATYYKDIPLKSGNFYITDIPNIYNVIIFSSFVKDENGDFKLKNGQYITYDDYELFKDSSDPDRNDLVLNNTYVYHSGYSDIEYGVSVPGNDSYGFIDLAIPEIFKKNIEKIKAQGRKVLLSVGGLGVNFTIDNPGDFDSLRDAILEVIDLYGFDGIDLPLEESNLVSPIDFANLIADVVGSVRQSNPDFWLTTSLKYNKLYDLSGNAKAFIDQLAANFSSGKIDPFNYIWPRLFNIDESGLFPITYSDENLYAQTNLFGLNGYEACGLDIYEEENNQINRLNMFDFIPKFVWATTNDSGYSDNHNIFESTIPSNKLALYIPSDKKVVNFCKDVQTINPEDLDALISNLNEANLDAAGFVSFDTLADANKGFAFGNAINDEYEVSRNNGSGKFLGEITISNSAAQINIAIDAIAQASDFSSIENLVTEVDIYSDGIVKERRVYYVPFNPEAQTNFVISDLRQGVGDIASIRINGLANPATGVYYKPIVSQVSINNADIDFPITSFEAVDEGDLNQISITVTGEFDNSLLEDQKLYYRSQNGEMQKYIYVTDNLLATGNYHFDLNDNPSLSPSFNGVKVNSISSGNLNLTTDLTEITFTLEEISDEPRKLNFGYYKADGLLSINDLSSDVYDVVVFDSLIKTDSGKFVLNGGKFITYAEYAANKDENDPDLPIIRREFPLAAYTENPNGFIDLSAPDYIKKAISNMKDNGQKVILSISGDLNSFEINNEFDSEFLKTVIMDIVDSYGFDGIDLNLSASFYSGNGNKFAQAIKNLVDYKKSEGIDFWLTISSDYKSLIKKTEPTFYSDFIDYLGMHYINYFCPKMSDQGLNFIKYNDDKYYSVTNMTDLSETDKKCGLGEITALWGKPNRVGLFSFIPKLVWALTTDDGNSYNPDFYQIPAEKLIVILPVNWRNISGCSDVQVLSKNQISSLISSLNNMELYIGGFGSLEARNDTTAVFKPSADLDKSDIDFKIGRFLKDKLSNLISRKAEKRTIKKKALNFKKQSLKKGSFKSINSLLDTISKIDANLYDLEDNFVKKIEIFDREFKINGLETGKGYKLKISGIGDPLTGEYYHPIEVKIPYVNSYDIFTPVLNYQNSLSESELRDYEIIVLYQDQNAKNFKVNLVVDGFATKELSLIDSSFKLPKDVNFDFKVSAPTYLTPVVTRNGRKFFVDFIEKDKSQFLNIIYWNLGKNTETEYPKLSDIPYFYNVVVINDAVNKNWNSQNYGPDRIETDLYKNYLIEDFKNDILNLQARGCKVLFSLGNTVESINENDRLGFTSVSDDIISGLMSTFAKYNFDGIDINFDLAQINGSSKNKLYQYLDIFIFTDALVYLLSKIDDVRDISVSLSPKVSGLKKYKEFIGNDKNPYRYFVKKMGNYFALNEKNYLFVAPNPYQGFSKITYKGNVYDLKLDNSVKDYLSILIEVLSNQNLSKNNSTFDVSKLNIVPLFPSSRSLFKTFNVYENFGDIKETINDLYGKGINIVGIAGSSADYDFTSLDNVYYQNKAWQQADEIDSKSDEDYKVSAPVTITLDLSSDVDFVSGSFIRNILQNIQTEGFIYKIDNDGREILIEKFNMKIGETYTVVSDTYLENTYKVFVKGFAYPAGNNFFYLNPITITGKIFDENGFNLDLRFEKNLETKAKINFMFTLQPITNNQIKVKFYDANYENNDGFIYLECPFNNSYYFVSKPDLNIGFNLPKFDDYYYLSNTSNINIDSQNGYVKIDYYSEVETLIP